MFGQKKVCSCCKQKYATHFYKVVINGHSVEVSLCDDCAKKFDFADHYNVFLSSLMNDLFEPSYNPFEEETPTVKRVCKCGATEEDILNTGRFGCSECYKTFSDIVQKYVNRLGGKTYAGAMPEHVSKPGVTPPSIDDQIQALHQKIQECLAKEDYAKAQEYKNQIDALQQKKKNIK